MNLVFLRSVRHIEQNFGSTFYAKQLFAQYVGFYNCCHILVFGAEWQTVDYFGVFSDIEVVDILGIKPQKQCALGGVANGFYVVFVAEIEVGCGICSDYFIEQI